MNNLTLAVEVAISVRNYLRESVELRPIPSKEVQENQEKIVKQLRNITKL